MEFIILFVVIAVILFILGVALESVLTAALWIIEAMFIFLAFFFFLTDFLLLLSKKQEVKFLGIEKKGRTGNHAVYEFQELPVTNLFPMDAIFKKEYEKKEMVKVRILDVDGHYFLMDRISQIVVWIGLVTFGAASVLYGLFVL